MESRNENISFEYFLTFHSGVVIAANERVGGV